MRDYLQLNESESALDNVVSTPLNGKTEEDAQAFIMTELKSVSMVNKTAYPDTDAYVDYIIDYCYGIDLFPELISSKDVKTKKDPETGKVESGYSFVIFEFIFMSEGNEKEITLTAGFRIDDDGNTMSLSLYFY